MREARGGQMRRDSGMSRRDLSSAEHARISVDLGPADHCARCGSPSRKERKKVKSWGATPVSPIETPPRASTNAHRCCDGTCPHSLSRGTNDNPEVDDPAPPCACLYCAVHALTASGKKCMVEWCGHPQGNSLTCTSLWSSRGERKGPLLYFDGVRGWSTSPRAGV